MEPYALVRGVVFVEMFSQHYERGSTVVTSHLPFGTSVFGSERLTAALFDRR